MKFIFIFIIYNNIFINCDDTSKPNFNNNKKTCNQKLLSIYGLKGSLEPTEEINKICPEIKKNCCLKDDEITIKKIWNEEIKVSLENQYNSFLNILRYLFNYYDNFKVLAKSMKKSKSEKCSNTSINFLKFNLSKKLIKELIENQNKKTIFISNIRSNIYCSICDYDSLSMIWTKENKIEKQFQNNIYLNKKYCIKLINENIEYIYQYYKIINKYIYDINNLMECKMKTSDSIKINNDNNNKLNKIRNCFFNKDKYLIFFCEFICEEFNLYKWNDIFDGDIEYVYKIYNKLKNNKIQYFGNSYFSSFKSYDLLEKNIKYKKFNENIIKNILSNKDLLKNFNNDIVLKGGFNPIYKVLSKTLKIRINYSSIKIILLSINILLYFN